MSVRRALSVAGSSLVGPCLLALGLMAAGPAEADWSGFYAPPTAALAAQAAAGPPVDESGVCVREILQAQLRHGIPGNILLGIGLQEAGVQRDGQLTVWPWAVNAAGEGRIFDNREAALDWVASRQADGVESIDVGCMQINLRWHPDAFATPTDGFDAARNVDYAARFLADLYRQTGDWTVAAGSYHSFSPDRRATYLAALSQNVAVANARLDGFRALAAGGQGGGATVAALPPPLPEVPEGRVAIWSSGLTEADAPDGRRSIYSSRDLRPVLPAFISGGPQS